MLPKWVLFAAAISQIALFFYLKPWRTVAVYSAAWGKSREIRRYRNAGIL